MTTLADNMRRTPMGEVCPYDRAARLLGAPGADAGFTSCPNRRFGLPRARKNNGTARQWLEKDGHMANPGLVTATAVSCGPAQTVGRGRTTIYMSREEK